MLHADNEDISVVAAVSAPQNTADQTCSLGVSSATLPSSNVTSSKRATEFLNSLGYLKRHKRHPSSSSSTASARTQTSSSSSALSAAAGSKASSSSSASWDLNQQRATIKKSQKKRWHQRQTRRQKGKEMDFVRKTPSLPVEGNPIEDEEKELDAESSRGMSPRLSKQHEQISSLSITDLVPKSKERRSALSAPSALTAQCVIPSARQVNFLSTLGEKVLQPARVRPAHHKSSDSTSNASSSESRRSPGRRRHEHSSSSSFSLSSSMDAKRNFKKRKNKQKYRKNVMHNHKGRREEFRGNRNCRCVSRSSSSVHSDATGSNHFETSCASSQQSLSSNQMTYVSPPGELSVQFASNNSSRTSSLHSGSHTPLKPFEKPKRIPDSTAYHEISPLYSDQWNGLSLDQQQQLLDKYRSVTQVFSLLKKRTNKKRKEGQSAGNAVRTLIQDTTKSSSYSKTRNNPSVVEQRVRMRFVPRLILYPFEFSHAINRQRGPASRCYSHAGPHLHGGSHKNPFSSASVIGAERHELQACQIGKISGENNQQRFSRSLSSHVHSHNEGAPVNCRKERECSTEQRCFTHSAVHHDDHVLGYEAALQAAPPSSAAEEAFHVERPLESGITASVQAKDLDPSNKESDMHRKTEERVSFPQPHNTPPSLRYLKCGDASSSSSGDTVSVLVTPSVNPLQAAEGQLYANSNSAAESFSSYSSTSSKKHHNRRSRHQHSLHTRKIGPKEHQKVVNQCWQEAVQAPIAMCTILANYAPRGADIWKAKQVVKPFEGELYEVDSSTSSRTPTSPEHRGSSSSSRRHSRMNLSSSHRTSYCSSSRSSAESVQEKAKSSTLKTANQKESNTFSENKILRELVVSESSSRKSSSKQLQEQLQEHSTSRFNLSKASLPQVLPHSRNTEQSTVKKKHRFPPEEVNESNVKVTSVKTSGNIQGTEVAAINNNNFHDTGTDAKMLKNSEDDEYQEFVVNNQYMSGNYIELKAHQEHTQLRAQKSVQRRHKSSVSSSAAGRHSDSSDKDVPQRESCSGTSSWGSKSSTDSNRKNKAKHRRRPRHRKREWSGDWGSYSTSARAERQDSAVKPFEQEAPGFFGSLWAKTSYLIRSGSGKGNSFSGIEPATSAKLATFSGARQTWNSFASNNGVASSMMLMPREEDGIARSLHRHEQSCSSRSSSGGSRHQSGNSSFRHRHGRHRHRRHGVPLPPAGTTSLYSPAGTGGASLGPASLNLLTAAVLPPTSKESRMVSYAKVFINARQRHKHSAFYDAYFLDSDHITCGERRRKNLVLPGYRTTIISFVEKKVLKKDLNAHFYVQHPSLEVREIKLTQLRKIRHELLLYVMEEGSPLELTTMAHAYWYFERLAEQGMVGKINRKVIMASCILLGIKFLESGDVGKKITYFRQRWLRFHKTGGGMGGEGAGSGGAGVGAAGAIRMGGGVGSPTAEEKEEDKEARVDWEEVLRMEFTVYVGLDFTLLPERGSPVVKCHVERLLQQINVTAQEYFSKKFIPPEHFHNEYYSIYY